MIVRGIGNKEKDLPTFLFQPLPYTLITEDMPTPGKIRSVSCAYRPDRCSARRRAYFTDVGFFMGWRQMMHSTKLRSCFAFFLAPACTEASADEAAGSDSVRSIIRSRWRAADLSWLGRRTTSTTPCKLCQPRSISRTHPLQAGSKRTASGRRRRFGAMGTSSSSTNMTSS